MKDRYTRIQEAKARYAAEHWITLKPNHGGKGVHVQIDGEGNIAVGPAALKGHNVKSLPKRGASTSAGPHPAVGRAMASMKHVTNADQAEEHGKNHFANDQEARNAFKNFGDFGKAVRKQFESQNQQTTGHEQVKPPTGNVKVPGESPATAKAIADLGSQNQPRTAPPPGGYNPNPASGKAARVGVPGMVVPPPPKNIPRLNNLTPEEREVENEFATMFESDPDGMADKMLKAMANGMGDGPNIFATDEAKGLYSKWKGQSVPGPDGKPQLTPETKEFRSKFNTSLHQTANAVAKKAFLKYLDDVVSKLPEDRKTVLVTAGGCASGKTFCLGGFDGTKHLQKLAGATWDAAGEQNSTELPWIAKECGKRGIKVTAVYVHADPSGTWENPQRGVIERAGKQGRMVDARAYADSYTYGARNFHKFAKDSANDPNVQTIVLDNTRPPKGKDANGKPIPDIVSLPEVPSHMLSMEPDSLYATCLAALDKSPAPPAVKQGGSAGSRIWGPPRDNQQGQRQ